jgi:hypothetical protein
VDCGFSASAPGHFCFVTSLLTGTGARANVVIVSHLLENKPCPAYIPLVPKQPQREFKVGDRVTVSLYTGRIVEGVVKAIIQKTDGTRLQVDYGQDQTALVHLWQVHPAK